MSRSGQASPQTRPACKLYAEGRDIRSRHLYDGRPEYTYREVTNVEVKTAGTEVYQIKTMYALKIATRIPKVMTVE